MNEQLLKFENISKNYGSLEALKNINFSIPENSIFGILGANGSGKSTFMKILPNLIKKWTGNIYYNEKLILSDNKILRQDFGYLIEAPTFYEYLSAKQNLDILARISGSDSNRIKKVLKLVNLHKRSSDKVHSFSYGMKQRLGIAQALLHDPKVIVLDEPNNGLDPNGIDDMISLLKKLKSEGKTICLSTHNLRDVEEICTHFTVFNNGNCSKTTSMSEQLSNSNRWIINLKHTDDLLSKIKEKFKIISIHENNVLIESTVNDTVNQLNSMLIGYEVHKISKQSNLIEYFNDDKFIL